MRIGLGTAGSTLEAVAQHGMIEQELLRLINTERTRVGRKSLALSRELAYAARLHSADMLAKGYFSHTSQDGRELRQRAEAAGYFSSRAIRAWSIGENIGLHTGIPSAAEIFKMWRESPGHYTNMIEPEFTEMGLGIATGYHPCAGRAAVYTLDFGMRRI